MYFLCHSSAYSPYSSLSFSSLLYSKKIIALLGALLKQVTPQPAYNPLTLSCYISS